MLKNQIEKLIQGQDLSLKETEAAINIILENKANVPQIAAFLTLLHSKKETVDEMLGIISAARKNMLPINVPGDLLDIVGTGGDKANTVNISTAAAIVIACFGVKVAKHGNRAVSSQCGSADVLQKLGVKIDLTPEQVAHSINTVGIGFCFSPNFHPTMQQLRVVRKELNIPTSFNLLGPLLNPARTQYNLIGVYSKKLLELMAELFFQLGVEHALIVNGNGLDELSCLGPVDAIAVTRSGKTPMVIDPQKLGLRSCTLSELQGGDADKNARLLIDALSGKQDNALTQTILLNAAVGLWLYGKFTSIELALTAAHKKLTEGAAAHLLEQWIECTNKP
jgi:anthranilate phosphoribosyltransferase